MEQFLAGLRQADHGYGMVPGEASAALPTAFALLSLKPRQGSVQRGELQETAFRLTRWQQENGSLELLQGQYPCTWPTMLFIWALSAFPEFKPARDRALDCLLNQMKSSKPNSLVVMGNAGGDCDLDSWGWCDHNYSWVVPTALAVCALKATGRGGDLRTGQASRMLLQRQLPSGGWNYGNTIVLESELLPLPDTTGLALYALAGKAVEADVTKSLAYAAQAWEVEKAPLSLAWLCLGLNAWNHPVPDAEKKLGRACAETLGIGLLNAELAGMTILALSWLPQGKVRI